MPAGLLEALHNETPGSEPAMSPTNKLHAAYEPISEAELLADGLIEPVSPRPLPYCHDVAMCMSAMHAVPYRMTS